MTNLGTRINASELMVSHVCKLVQLELVRLIQLVSVVNMLNIGFEHIESLVLVFETPGHRVVAPPPLVQTPQALFSLQLLIVIIETLGKTKSQNQSERKQKNLVHFHCLVGIGIGIGIGFGFGFGFVTRQDEKLRCMRLVYIEKRKNIIEIKMEVEV